MKVKEVNFHSMETQEEDFLFKSSWSSWSFSVPPLFIPFPLCGLTHGEWATAVEGHGTSDRVHVYTTIADVISRAFTDSPVSFSSLHPLFSSLQWLFQIFPMLSKFPFLVPLSILNTLFILVVKAHSLLQRLWESSVFLLLNLKIHLNIFLLLKAIQRLWIRIER